MTVRMNPVLGRELRERMRTARAFVALFVFLAFLVLTVYVVYEGTASSGTIEFDLARQTRLGRDLYEWVLFIMLVLVLFFVPGLTAGAVAGERERQTLLPLQVTLLRPRSILLGKVLAAIAFVLLLIAAALPVMAVAFLLGGIRFVDGLIGVGVLFLTSVLVATMIVAISSFSKRVQTATLLAYGFSALLVVAGPIVFLVLGVIDQNRGDDIVNPPAVLLAINPVSLVADATAGENVYVGESPLQAVRQALVETKHDNGDSWFSWFPSDGGGGDFAIVDQQRRGTAAWVVALGFLGIVALLLFGLATRRLRTPAESER